MELQELILKDLESGQKTIDYFLNKFRDNCECTIMAALAALISSGKIINKGNTVVINKNYKN